jgi:hypothetical protein
MRQVVNKEMYYIISNLFVDSDCYNWRCLINTRQFMERRVLLWSIRPLCRPCQGQHHFCLGGYELAIPIQLSSQVASNGVEIVLWGDVSAVENNGKLTKMLGAWEDRQDILRVRLS